MTRGKPLTRPPLRTLVGLPGIPGLLARAHLIFPTGKTIRDGLANFDQLPVNHQAVAL